MSIISRRLDIFGMGVVTDTYEDIGKLLEDREAAGEVQSTEEQRAAIRRARCLSPSDIGQHDTLTRLSLQAVHQATTMCDLVDEQGKMRGGEDVGMLFVTSWGTIDSTVGYLESMCDAQGRYASPRHFSRSVFSSVAAAAAIHLGIHGPCETLSFPGKPVIGALQSAWRLLAAQRCRWLVVVWAEQAAEIATELSKIAAEKLRRLAYARYAINPGGYGAIALVMAAAPPAGGKGAPVGFQIDVNSILERAWSGRGRPFPMDAALELVSQIMAASAKQARPRSA